MPAPNSCLPLQGEGGPLAVDEVISSLFSFKSRSLSPHQALRASFPLRGKPLSIRAPLLLFPKITQCFARCDFREPFDHIPATLPKEVNAAALSINACKSKNHTFCFCPLHRTGGVTEEGEFAAFL